MYSSLVIAFLFFLVDISWMVSEIERRERRILDEREIEKRGSSRFGWFLVSFLFGSAVLCALCCLVCVCVFSLYMCTYVEFDSGLFS